MAGARKNRSEAARVIRLTPEEREALRRNHPAAAGAEELILVSGSREAVRTVRSTLGDERPLRRRAARGCRDRGATAPPVARRRLALRGGAGPEASPEVLARALEIAAALVEDGQRRSDAIEALLPPRVPTAPAVLQMRRNAAAREALVAEFGLLSSADVADLAGSRARNRAALAHRWKDQGKLFTVPLRGEQLFPAFQLDDEGRPRPVVAEVLAAFGEGGWPTALWFLAEHGELGYRRPVDLLDADPASVAAAARAEAETVL